MRRGLLALCCVLLATPAVAEEWTLEGVVAINLAGIDLTNQRIHLALEPIIGVSVTDGNYFVLGGVSFDITDSPDDLWSWMPVVGGGTRFNGNGPGVTLALGLKLREPIEAGTGWRHAWQILGGLGTPVKAVK